MKRMPLLFISAICAVGSPAFARAQGTVGQQWQVREAEAGRAIRMVDGAEVSPLCAELQRSGAPVSVMVEESAAGVLRSAGGRNGSSSITGFTVSLFRDNSQNARTNSYEVAAQFSEAFPGVEAEVSYQAPWFRVTAGRFVDRTDAVALCGRAIAQFKKAVVVQQEFTLQQIIESEKTVLREPEPVE